MTALRMAPTVRKLQSRIGYNFRNAQYLWEAVQAPGSIVRSGEVEGAGTGRHSVGFQRFPDGNRRLAVLGDTVLKLALVEDWYRGEAVRGMATYTFCPQKAFWFIVEQRGSPVSSPTSAPTLIST